MVRERSEICKLRSRVEGTFALPHLSGVLTLERRFPERLVDYQERLRSFSFESAVFFEQQIVSRKTRPYKF